MVISLMLSQDRAHRGLMAVDSATAAGPQPRPQHRGGRPGESFLLREECANPGSPRDLARGVVGQGKKSQPGRCGIEAGPRERIAALDPPAPGRRDRRSQAVKESPGSGVFPAMTTPAAAKPHLHGKSPFPQSRDRTKGSGCKANDEGQMLGKATSRHGGGGKARHTAGREPSSSTEAISASGALNRPRRRSGGITASTASSFCAASMRK